MLLQRPRLHSESTAAIAFLALLKIDGLQSEDTAFARLLAKRW
jgi:hypothetical protein